MEDIKKAIVEAYKLTATLREMNKNATPIESIIIMPMIRTAANLKNDLEVLLDAKEN